MLSIPAKVEMPARLCLPLESLYNNSRAQAQQPEKFF